MGGAGSGPKVDGGPQVDRLEDARWPLVEALEAAQQFRSVLNRAAALLQRMECAIAESQAALIRAEKARGATHFRDRDTVRSGGLTVSVRQRKPGHSGPNVAIAAALVDAIRDDTEGPLADTLHRLDGFVQLQGNGNGHGGTA